MHTFEEKSDIYSQLSCKQRIVLKTHFREFDSRLWYVEPCVELFGVTWSHSDLLKLL
jgi:hypothetical protein